MERENDNEVHFTDREQDLSGFKSFITTENVPTAIAVSRALAAEARIEASQNSEEQTENDSEPSRSEADLLDYADDLEEFADKLEKDHLPEIGDDELAALLAIESLKDPEQPYNPAQRDS